MPQPKPVAATMADLERAVYHRDDTPPRLSERHIRAVVRLTALQLGQASLSRPVEIDLGNGYKLQVTTCQA